MEKKTKQSLPAAKPKPAEENIGNSREMMQRIIDFLPIRIFWKDMDLKYLGCNEIFAKDAGKNKPADMIGLDDFKMSWHEQTKSYQDDDRAVINSGKPKLNFEESIINSQGGRIWIKTSKVPLRDPQGNIVGVLGTFEDITEGKQAEEKMKQKNAEMEQMNKLMTGRELKMVELKEVIRELKKRLGEV